MFHQYTELYLCKFSLKILATKILLFDDYSLADKFIKVIIFTSHNSSKNCPAIFH
jgi:hypothetical protein